jgi:hypothetical protein
MPHGYSVREAVNEGEVHSALCKVTAGYGGVVKFARRVGFTREYVQGMLYGSQRMSARVARTLGYELRWVKIEKKYGDGHERVRGDGAVEGGAGT